MKVLEEQQAERQDDDNELEDDHHGGEDTFPVAQLGLLGHEAASADGFVTLACADHSSG